MTVPKLHSVLNRTVVSFMDLGPLDPGFAGIVTSRCAQSLRVIGARAVAEFPPSRAALLMRRIPGVRRLLRDRDAAARERATAQLRVDHITVGNYACLPDKCAALPIVAADREISVHVTNTGRRPLIARVLVEGVLL